MKNKGFTLIELMAVIIILAVIALISTPIVLNVIEDAKDKSNLNSVYGIIDGARLYFAESLLDETKQEDINNNRNIYGKVGIQGEKPAEGYLYADKNGMIGVAVIYGNKCYKKGFSDEKIIVTDETICELGFAGEDNDLPEITYEVQGTPFNDQNWANVNFFVKIKVSDKTSGVANYKWCVSNSECDPNLGVEVKGETNTVSIINESSSNQICVIARDNKGNTTEKKCSELYKLDKTKPEISGITDIRINKGEAVNLETGITVNDSLSGINGTYSYNPTSIDTNKAGTTVVTYSVSDKAGNTTTTTRQVVVDAEAPSITYTPQGNPFNSNGWAKSDFYVKGEVIDNSGTGIKEAKWCMTAEATCTPNAEFTSTTSPLINTESASNRICIAVTDNSNKTTTLCSNTYKLDKTEPITGTANIKGTLGTNSWYTSNVTITVVNGSDSLSGHSRTTTNVSSITTNTTGQVVTITTTDIAGNTSTRNYTVKLDKTAPSLTAKTGTFEIMQGDNVLSSTYFNTPSYSISGAGTLTCNPVNTSILTAGYQTVVCTATGLNGLSTSANKIITVDTKSLIAKLKMQYKDTNITGLLKDGDNYYYKGTREDVTNNFVWYEGNLWRVVQVNSDNTVTMVTQQPITALQPASVAWTTEQQYKDSYINTWLNNVFYNSISDKSKIRQSTFNIGIYTNVSEITTTQYVGLLDNTQFTRTGGNSFLNIRDTFWLANIDSSSRVRTVVINGDVANFGVSYALGVRPVLKISDLIIASGDGSLSNPFRETSVSTNSSNVKVGEYISVPGSSNFCGSDARCLFRVVNKDSDSLKVILNGFLPTTSAFSSNINTTFSSSSTIYTPLTNFANSISTNYRYSGNKTFNIGTYPYVSGTGQDYNLVKNQTYSGNVGLPVVGEMFSGNDIDATPDAKTFVNVDTIENNTVSGDFFLMNAYSSSTVRHINDSGQLEQISPVYAESVRPVIFLKQGLTFTKGDGTAENPYFLGN